MLLSLNVAEKSLTMDSFFQDFTLAIIGLIIVGIALAAISFVLYLLKFFGGENKPKEQPQAPSVQKVQVTENSIQESTQKDNQAEIVAAIVAAIASNLNTTPDKLVVKSFRKATAWTESAKKQMQG